MPVIELPQMRDKVQVFGDRAAAGEVLAKMLEDYHGGRSLVLGIPAGGVAVAAVIAKQLSLQLDVAVVNKITPPWNTEWGFGAVAFDGSVVMNQQVVASLDMDQPTLETCIDLAKQKVRRRLKLLRGDQPLPDLAGREIILVDDGLATGITVQGAVQALHRLSAGGIIVAIPTAHASSITQLIDGKEVHAVYCPNIRSGYQFAVAEAYHHWHDLTDQDILNILRQFAAKK